MVQHGDVSIRSRFFILVPFFFDVPTKMEEVLEADGCGCSAKCAVNNGVTPYHVSGRMFVRLVFEASDSNG